MTYSKNIRVTTRWLEKKVGFMHIFTFESILYYNIISTKINKYYEWTLILVDIFEKVRLSLKF